jgi:hypothetical protein
MAIDYETDVGKVRLLVPDVNETAGLLFSDAQIEAFLSMARGSGTALIKRAAAAALETAASSEAMVSKVIKTQDLTTDGAKVSDALLARAARLREQADDDEDDDATDGGGFDVVDFRDPYRRRYSGEAAEWLEG